ncbi:MAG: nitrite reductase small subunit NirD [Candidatus Omnitrophica bacterium]|nr:nitrite reductase small subunit NirD [Candidatus Omnitrophota bacterium]
MNDPVATEWCFVAECGAIPLREGRKVTYGDHHAALFNLGTEYLAIDNRCPHREGPLADGIVAGKSVFCPLHAWKISLETGCVQSGGEGCVKRYPVKVAENRIYIAFPRQASNC